MINLPFQLHQYLPIQTCNLQLITLDIKTTISSNIINNLYLVEKVGIKTIPFRHMKPCSLNTEECMWQYKPLVVVLVKPLPNGYDA